MILAVNLAGVAFAFRASIGARDRRVPERAGGKVGQTNQGKTE
jgi:hypothetical protein